MKFDKNKILGPWVEFCGPGTKTEYNRKCLGDPFPKYVMKQHFIYWIEFDKSYTLHSHFGCPFTFGTAEEAKNALDEYLIHKGFTILSQEEFDKISILV